MSYQSSRFSSVTGYVLGYFLLTTRRNHPSQDLAAPSLLSRLRWWGRYPAPRRPTRGQGGSSRPTIRGLDSMVIPSAPCPSDVRMTQLRQSGHYGDAAAALATASSPAAIAFTAASTSWPSP